jgi:hypothetical protein
LMYTNNQMQSFLPQSLIQVQLICPFQWSLSRFPVITVVIWFTTVKIRKKKKIKIILKK